MIKGFENQIELAVDGGMHRMVHTGEQPTTDLGREVGG